MGKKRRRAHFAVTVEWSGPATWKLVAGASTLVLTALTWLVWHLV